MESPKPTVSHKHSCDHEHHDGHGHTRRRRERLNGNEAERQKDKRRLLLALLLTGVISVAEAVGGIISNSLSLMSDAGHMFADMSGLTLSLMALFIAGRPADPRKTYGYYRAEILGALFNGMVLIGLAIWIVIEAMTRFKQPEAVQWPQAIGVALIGLVVNLAALRVLHQAHTLNVRSAFIHVLSDTLSSVGVLLGMGIIALTGWTWVDAALSLVIAAVIVWGALRIVKEAVDVLLEAVPAHLDVNSLREVMQNVKGVEAVHDLHVWTISSGIYALSAHLVVEDSSVSKNDELLMAMKVLLLEKFGIDHTTIQIESHAFSHAGEVH